MTIEKYNKDGYLVVQSVIDNDNFVVIWPDSVKKKDINDMILDGMDIDEILNILNNNTFQKMEAKIRFIKWKKI